MATKKKKTTTKKKAAKKKKTAKRPSRDKAMANKEANPSKLLSPAKPTISHVWSEDNVKQFGDETHDNNSPFSMQMPKRSNVGRPSKYEPRFCQMLVDHGAAGYSFESFAGLIGVCIDTLYEWAKVHKEFSDAKRRGSAAALLWWENAGMVGMSMPSKAWTPTVHSRNMNARFPEYGWRGDRPAGDGDEAAGDELEFVAEFS